MKKIENIIESCTACRCCGYYERRGDAHWRAVGIKATICDLAGKLIALDNKDYEGALAIPAWCPLETYQPDADTKAAACAPMLYWDEPAATLTPLTVTLCGLKWMSEPLTGHGGTEILGRTYYTQDEALEAAKQVGDGWRLPTKEEFKALADLGSTWDANGRWFGGNHDTDHRGSLFFEASGYRDSSSVGLDGVGRYGYSWSSSPNSASSEHGSPLFFGSVVVNPENSSLRAYGFPVRLVREAKDIQTE